MTTTHIHFHDRPRAKPRHRDASSSESADFYEIEADGTITVVCKQCGQRAKALSRKSAEAFKKDHAAEHKFLRSREAGRGYGDRKTRDAGALTKGELERSERKVHKPLVARDRSPDGKAPAGWPDSFRYKGREWHKNGRFGMATLNSTGEKTQPYTSWDGQSSDSDEIYVTRGGDVYED